MAPPNTLVSLFENISFQDKPLTHVLEVQYPVRGLLPPGFDPLLKKPANLANREAPPHDQRRLGTSQSAYTINYTTQNRENPNAGFDDMIISSNKAFEGLTCSPGKSLLEAVTFFDGEFGQENDQKTHTYNFELWADSWEQMVRDREMAWVDALDELMNRSTDRAYYHVRNRITQDFGEDVAFGEEAGWSAGWGSFQSRKQEQEVNEMGEMMSKVVL